MQHYHAAQIQYGPSAGLWHYIVNNGPAVGYCSPFKTCQECQGHSLFVEVGHPNACEACNSKGYVTLPEGVRCAGHPTEVEACEHYRQYLLDTLAKPFEDEQAKLRCHVCKEWTTGRVSIGNYRSFILCPKHQGRETLEEIFPPISQSWES